MEPPQPPRSAAHCRCFDWAVWGTPAPPNPMQGSAVAGTQAFGAGPTPPFPSLFSVLWVYFLPVGPNFLLSVLAHNRSSGSPTPPTSQPVESGGMGSGQVGGGGFSRGCNSPTKVPVACLLEARGGRALQLPPHPHPTTLYNHDLCP